MISNEDIGGKGEMVIFTKNEPFYMEFTCKATHLNGAI